MKTYKIGIPSLLVTLGASALLTGCVTAGYYEAGHYAYNPGYHTGSVYVYNGRHYSGGRYETGRYYYNGRYHTNRYYHGGRYYYGGSHRVYKTSSSHGRYDGSRHNSKHHVRYGY